MPRWRTRSRRRGRASGEAKNPSQAPISPAIHTIANASIRGLTARSRGFRKSSSTALGGAAKTSQRVAMIHGVIVF
jgi:hypothetical protein